MKEWQMFIQWKKGLYEQADLLAKKWSLKVRVILEALAEFRNCPQRIKR
jgi:hypothetical protein